MGAALPLPPLQQAGGLRRGGAGKAHSLGLGSVAGARRCRQRQRQFHPALRLRHPCFKRSTPAGLHTHRTGCPAPRMPAIHTPTHPPHSADPMAARCHSGCHTASCKGAGAATVSLTRGRVLVVAHVFAGEHTCGRPSDLQPVSSTGSWMPCTNFPCRPCILSSMAAMHAACLAFFSIHTSHVLPLTPTCSCMPWGRPAWKTGCPP